jgi:hypothetical protein
VVGVPLAIGNDGDGSPVVDLRYRFVLRDDVIAELVIAP